MISIIRSVTFILAASALVTFAPSALAKIIASDNFNYYFPGGPPKELHGQNGGTGWANAWTANTGITQVVDPGVDLSDNRALQFTDNSNNAAYRQLGSAFTGNVLFVDFLIQLDAGVLNNNDFLALWLEDFTGTPSISDNHTAQPNIGIKANGGDSGNTTNDVFVRTNGTNGNMLPNSNITTGVTHHIVGRLSRSAPGNYTKYEAWLNPVVGNFGTPGAIFNGNAGISQITQVGFRTANLDSGDIVLIDNLRLSTTWNEALRIPEPASHALLGVGLIGLGFLRRRKT